MTHRRARQIVPFDEDELKFRLIKPSVNDQVSDTLDEFVFTAKTENPRLIYKRKIEQGPRVEVSSTKFIRDGVNYNAVDILRQANQNYAAALTRYNP